MEVGAVHQAFGQRFQGVDDTQGGISDAVASRVEEFLTGADEVVGETGEEDDP
ncbi:hypothetical protein [Actinomadura meridiana]|uniref:hypothetical protein n=1 Tax=Actinomadura meridiana TaxID=559626 RepID=UPI0031EA17A7